MQMCGSITLICLIYCHLLQSLKIRSSACMEVYHQILILWTRLEQLIDRLRFLMRVQCAIYYGQIQMIAMVGVFLQEVQDLHLDKTFRKTSITPIV